MTLNGFQMGRSHLDGLQLKRHGPDCRELARLLTCPTVCELLSSRWCTQDTQDCFYFHVGRAKLVTRLTAGVSFMRMVILCAPHSGLKMQKSSISKAGKWC